MGEAKDGATDRGVAGPHHRLRRWRDGTPRNAAICRSILRFSHRCERSPSTQNAVSAPIAYRTIARPTTISPIVNQRPVRVRGWTESKLTEETVTTVM